jgi:hypothetical protein
VDEIGNNRLTLQFEMQVVATIWPELEAGVLTHSLSHLFSRPRAGKRVVLSMHEQARLIELIGML